MDRRKFLMTTGGAAAVAAGPAAASQANQAAAVAPGRESQLADATPLKLSMPWADTPHGPADSVRRLARRVEAMMGGRYRIEIAAGSGAPDGSADLVHGPAYGFSHHHPAFHYFAGLPGAAGLGAQDLAHWLAVGGGQMLWDDLAAEHGWKPVLAGHSGEAPPLWSRTPITRLSDLSGRGIAAAGLGADVARALGADAQDLAPHQVARALADGTVDAAEAGGLLASLVSGVPRVAQHATGHGLNGHGIAFALSVRLPVWERMSEADQAILSAAAAEEFQVTLAEARAHTNIARRVLATSFGVRFAPLPAEITEAIDRVAEATIAHVAGQDAASARIDQSYMAFRAALSGTDVPRRRTAIS